VHLSRQTAENVNYSISASWNLEKNFLVPFFRGFSKKCHLVKRLVSLLCLPDSRYDSPEFQQQAEELITISANLTDRQKMISKYWSERPYSEQPPGHWAQCAPLFLRAITTREDDVKMFFALTSKMLDASIAAWDAKRTYDSVRPVTAISTIFRGKKIRAWGGPAKGTVEMDGEQWLRPALRRGQYFRTMKTSGMVVAGVKRAHSMSHTAHPWQQRQHTAEAKIWLFARALGCGCLAF